MKKIATRIVIDLLDDSLSYNFYILKPEAQKGPISMPVDEREDAFIRAIDVLEEQIQSLQGAPEGATIQ